MRSLSILCAAALAIAATGHAAELAGTVVATDPAAQTLVVRTADGQAVTIRTNQATRVEQDQTVVERTLLKNGTQVQIVTTDVVGEEAIVSPTATRIVLVPSAPAVVQEGDEDDDDDDVDIDIDDGDDD